MLPRMTGVETKSGGSGSTNNATSNVLLTNTFGTCPKWGDEDFDDFLFLFDNFTALNEVPDDKKVRLLVEALGSKALKIKKLIKEDISTWDLELVKEIGRKAFSSKVNKFAAQEQLHNRVQQAGESASDYAAALRDLAEHCEYTPEIEDQTLKSRFLSGLMKREHKLKLYNTCDGKTYAQTVDEAILIETLERSVQRVANKSDDATNSIRSDKPRGDTRGDRRGDTRGDRRGDTRGDRRGDRGDRRGDANGSNQRSKRDIKCYGCGKMGHTKMECRSCWTCKKYGHSSRKCNNKKVNTVEERRDQQDPNANGSSSTLFINSINSLNDSGSEKMYLKCIFLGEASGGEDDVAVNCECDSGSVYTIINKTVWENLGKPKLGSNKAEISSASGHPINMLGEFKCTVVAGEIKTEISCLVADSSCLGVLLGTRALDKLVPKWRNGFREAGCHNTMAGTHDAFLKQVRVKFPNIFDGNTKPVKNVRVGLKMRGAEPVLARPYDVPPALAKRIRAELDRLCKEGVLYPVEDTEWASPMVTVIKKDGSVRICIDPSKTLNPHLINDHFPLPRIDDLLMKFANKKIFSLIDLKAAYQQIEMDPESQKLLTMNTPFGLFRYARMPFGISPAPSIFQRVITRILNGLPVLIYLDDIIVSASTEEEMKDLLTKVFQRLSEYNLKVNQEKSQYFLSKVTYLGHVITADGIEPDLKKIEAMLNAPAPTSVTELKSFIGMVEHYSKFIPELNTEMAPMFVLTRKGCKWGWTEEFQQTFEKVKEAIARYQLLTHYDPDKSMVLSVDASDKGMCGVLSHLEDDIEKPILFFSRVFTETEKRYPILHREALAIVWSLEKCYRYVFGTTITVVTDHKPLLGIFGKAGLPAVVATRLQRYQIRASIFNFVLRYRKGALNVLADFGSRHPGPEAPNGEDRQEEERAQVNCVSNNPKELNLNLIRMKTEEDDFLLTLRNYVSDGWPEEVPDRFKPWYKQRASLSTERGCVLFDDRVWIPESLKSEALRSLHNGHAGIVKMKLAARQYVFWPKLTMDIEKYVKSCETCVSTSNKAGKDEFSPWRAASKPWERVHVDFFHFGGNTFLILVDGYTRWIEVKKMYGTEARQVCNQLKVIFGMFGDPYCLVADNGPPYNSKEFSDFLKSRDIQYINSPPYHPQSNGLAERNVRTAKAFLKKALVDAESKNKHFKVEEVINEFLNFFRNTPGSADGLSPTEKMFAYLPRIGLRKLKISHTVASSPSPSPTLSYEIGEIAWWKDKLDPIRKRIKGVILRKLSDFVYEVKIGNNVRKAHTNQLSKYIARDKIFDVMGAKQAYEKANISPSVFVFEKGSLPVVSDRPVRDRKKPDRFEPSWFKTRKHSIKRKYVNSK